MKKQLFKNTFWNGFSVAFISGIGFFILPFMVDRLGAVQYGLFAIANVFSVTGYVSLFELGFQASVTRYVAKYMEEKEIEKMYSIVSTSFIVLLLIGVFLFIIFTIFKSPIVSLLSIPPEYSLAMSKVLTLVFASYIVLFPSIAIMGYWQGKQRYDILKITEITAWGLYFSCICFYLMNGGQDFSRIILFSICAHLLKFSIYFLLFLKDVLKNECKFKIFNKEELRAVWSMSKYLVISKPASLLFYNLPKILVATLLGPVSMTIYDVAEKIPRVLKSSLGILNSAIMPVSSVLQTRKDKGRIKNLYVLGMKCQILIVLSIVTIVFLYAKSIFSYWMPSQYVEVYKYMRILLIWSFTTPLVAYTLQILSGMQVKLKEMTILSCLMSVTSLVFSLTFIKILGLGAIMWGFVFGGLVWIPSIIFSFIKEVGVMKRELSSLFLNSFKFLPIAVLFWYLIGKNSSSLLSMILYASINWVLFASLLWKFTFTKKEKMMLLSSLPFYPVELGVNK